ncbi:MAG TPA: hypothetical protein VHW66_21035 [Stellaceae bacterium]|jgi:hypothetical protein|nr:hypothetical protein [Stellaceae bacterium]
MATFVEDRSVAGDAEPVGFLTEGIAGIAVIVLAIIALAGASSGATLTAIATIVIGVGLMVQGFNTAAENARPMSPEAAVGGGRDVTGEVMVDCVAGGVGIVLGILALIGVAATPVLLPCALIVFGSALLLSGALEMPASTVVPLSAAGTQAVSTRGSAGTGGMEILVGIAGIVLGILALLTTHSAILVVVGFIAVGAALLMVGATFSGAILRIVTRTTG